MAEQGTSPVDAAVAAGRRAWPGVQLPDEAFGRHLAERWGTEPVPDDVAASLYLACACGRGDAAALRAFDAQYMPGIRRAIGRVRLSAADADDVAQTLRQHLLVGTERSGPRILEYAGRGELAGWLRVTAARAALRCVRGHRPEVQDDDAILASRAADDPPELGYMKELYRRTFRQAFQAAMEGLDPREKNLLRQHFVDGLSIDELGPLYGVHRATAARWVARAREALLSETRKQFMKRANITPRECESVLRLVRSRLDVTLSRLLGS